MILSQIVTKYFGLTYVAFFGNYSEVQVYYWFYFLLRLF